MKNILKIQDYVSFQNLAFFGLIILAYQNFETTLYMIVIL